MNRPLARLSLELPTFSFPPTEDEQYEALGLIKRMAVREAIPGLLNLRALVADSIEQCHLAGPDYAMDAEAMRSVLHETERAINGEDVSYL